MRLCVVLFWLWVAVYAGAEVLRVATFNLENYTLTDRRAHGRYFKDYPKPEEEKAAVRAVIAAVDADILAVQEIGPRPFIDELLRDLAKMDIHYPHVAWMQADDEVRMLAVLSRVPIVGITEHTGLDFKYFDERMPVKRGLLECRFETNGTEWTLFNLHLKSRWSELDDDPECNIRRLGEAEAIRKYIYDEHWQGGTGRYMVLGDCNDHKASRPLARFLKQGDKQLSELLDASDSHGDSWTFHYAKEDRYERIDHILVSPALKLAVVDERAVIEDSKEMRAASDHRVVYCDLEF